MKLPVASMLTILGLATSAGCWAEECRLDQECAVSKSLLGRALMVFSTQTVERCDSLANVICQIARDRRRGGRGSKHESDTDIAVAEAQIRKALADTRIEEELRVLAASEKEEVRRLALEAALFDDEGFTAARDLRIEQLRRKVDSLPP